MMKTARSFLFTILFVVFSSCPVFAAGGLLYQSSEHMFSIELPEGWILDKEHRERNILVLAKTPEGESINVAVEKLGAKYAAYTFDDFSALDLEDYIKELEQKLHSLNADVTLQEWEVKKIADKKAVCLLLTLPLHSSDTVIQMKTLQVQIMNNARLYMITCGATNEKFPELRRVFEQSIHSIKFEMPGISL